MSADNSKKMIELRTSDGELFQVEEEVAVLLVTIQSLVEDGCGVPVPNFTGKTLAKVIEYCKKHVEADSENEGDDTVKANRKKEFDGERGELFQLLATANNINIKGLLDNFMNIKGLLELTSQTFVDMILDMKVEEVRELFNITKDFTPDEEEAILKECLQLISN